MGCSNGVEVYRCDLVEETLVVQDAGLETEDDAKGVD